MANRVITAAVSGESIKLSNKIAGASGSVNAVSLSFTFDSAWDGTTKKVYFYDANEGNPVVTVLTTNLLVGGAYVVPIPAEPLAYAGEMTLTVRGVELGADGETAERIILSATTTMKVLNAVTPSSDVAPVEPTATQTEQLQAEIDDILETISAAEASATAAAASETAAAGSASAAAGSATNAATSETNASTSASGAASSASAASGSASAASASETNAGNSAASATSSASAAATSESNAATSESNALSYKNAAVSAANTAQTKASEAAQSASGAAAAKTAAETAQAAAEAAQGSAETAEANAETAQASAETAKTAAEAAQAASEAAQSAAETAETNAETAETAAEAAAATATSKATEAAASATTAANKATEAAGSATAASDSAGAADASKIAAVAAKVAAETAQTAASTSASTASAKATLAESWAVGGTSSRTGEDANNSKYWCEQAQEIVGGDYLMKTGDGSDVTAAFNEAETRTNIATGETLATLFGKIKKWFAGLGTAAFTDMTAYDASGTAATVQGNLNTHTLNASNPHSVTKSQIGLGNVPNVATNDQTPTYNEASALANLISKEKLSVAFGKIKKAIAEFIAHKNSTDNPHGVTAAQAGADPTGTAASAVSGHNSAADAHTSLFSGKSDTGHTHDNRYYTESEADTLLAGKAASSHNHSASNITSGTLSIARGGTGAESAAAARTALGAQATLTAGTNITISGSTISATGGILPRIIVTAPTGSTVTCSKDSTTLTATEVSGTWTFNLPDYGTWTVTGTRGADTDSKAVVVDQVKLYTTSLGYLSDTFSANTWEAIIDACQSGSVPAAWVVGNQKTMTINSASYTVTIIGKNHDTYSSDGVTKAPLTFQLQDCYGTKYKMNATDTNSGGWTSCAMRSTHLPAILALMPTEVKASIQEVNKLSSAGDQSATINTTADKLFLLSEIEIFGSTTYSKSGEGSQYAYYSAGNSKVKNFSGSANDWWGRSPRGSNSATFCYVTVNGHANVNIASTSNGVAFGFCF